MQRCVTCLQLPPKTPSKVKFLDGSESSARGFLTHISLPLGTAMARRPSCGTEVVEELQQVSKSIEPPLRSYLMFSMRNIDKPAFLSTTAAECARRLWRFRNSWHSAPWLAFLPLYLPSWAFASPLVKASRELGGERGAKRGITNELRHHSKVEGAEEEKERGQKTCSTGRWNSRSEAILFRDLFVGTSCVTPKKPRTNNWYGDEVRIFPKKHWKCIGWQADLFTPPPPSPTSHFPPPPTHPLPCYSLSDKRKANKDFKRENVKFSIYLIS